MTTGRGRGSQEEPTHVRSTHPYGFRSGQWAEILTVVNSYGRDCWLIRFDDGTTDWLPIHDPSDHREYETR